jgi:argininosuccinate lyase / amino-acid N-acetyltransferase
VSRGAVRALPMSHVFTRGARPGDIFWIEGFVASFTGDGTLLPRSRANLIQHVRDFQVAVSGDELVGCGALQVVESGLAEIRSIAVDPGWQCRGIGSSILRALLDDAVSMRIPRVFCLTRRPDFFSRHGFREVSKDRFPVKIWGDCLVCPRRFACDEIAMELELPMKSEGAPSHRDIQTYVKPGRGHHRPPHR